MEDYNAMTVPEVSRLEGVVDLKPLMVRGKFALALRAEAAGDHDKAERLLTEAVEKEQGG